MQDLKKLQKLSIDAAKVVGKFLNEEKQNKKIIFEEIGRDIKLELDRSAEMKIRRILEESNIPVHGEELGTSDENLKWVVDPIDGTANYFRGLDQCCISIALMQKNESLIGTIFNFNSNDLFSAAKGYGATLNEAKIMVSNIGSKQNASITTGFPASETIGSSLKFLEDLHGWKKIRMFGSAALSCAYVASGKCDYYAEKGVYLWDFAAGICLVEEAGGKAIFSLIDEDRYEVVLSNGLL